MSVGGWDNTARVWEVATGKEISRMTHDALVESAIFNPYGNYVVSGSNDRTARVWGTATGKEIARMTHDDSVLWVKFSPDGKFVISGSADKTVRVWDAISGKEITRMNPDTRFAYGTFSPDGKYVIDNTAHVWFWRPEDLLSNACAYLPRNLNRAEWEQYIGGGLPFQAVCSNLPIEPESTPTSTP